MAGRKKVLILGAGGQLGTALSACLERTYDVAALTHKQLDICRKERLAEVISCQRPWAVINAAAWTDVDGCEKDAPKAFAVNAQAAGDVALQAARANAKVVHVSSDYVFDGLKKSPYTEEDRPNPLSIYGKSKLEGERLVAQAVSNALIVRSSWLFGMGRSNFVMRFLESARVQSEMPVVMDCRGGPTYTDDLAKAVEKLLVHDATGIFHVSNQGDCTWYEYAREILKILKIATCKIVPIRSGKLGRPAPRPAYSVLDNSRYRNFVGESLRPWQEALADFLQKLETEGSIHSNFPSPLAGEGRVRGNSTSPCPSLQRRGENHF